MKKVTSYLIRHCETFARKSWQSLSFNSLRLLRFARNDGLLLLLLLLPFASQASETLDYSELSKIPILHEGRIKPLDSFARVELKKIYGEKSLPEKSAIKWLAGTLLSPSEAMNERVFAVKSNDILQILALSETSDKLYSFNEIARSFSEQDKLIQTILAKDKKSLSENEQELLKLYEAVNDFAEIIGTFSLLTPLQDVPEKISNNKPVSYLELLKIKEKLNDDIKETLKEKGNNVAKYSPQEQENAKLSYRINLMETIDKHNTLVRIIPPTWQGTDEWLAPWAVLEKGAGSPKTATLFANWQKLLIAYNAQDNSAWQQNLSALKSTYRPYAIELEVIYNLIDPLSKVLFLYCFGVVTLIGSNLLRRKNIIPYAIIILGVAIHGFAIASRMFILMRPPVSTLYESMIFVSLMSASFGIILERKKQNGDSLLISASLSALLLASANVFAGSGDNLEVLIAVLNTNFWLATHVVCITTGYATSLISGALAHLYLVKRTLNASEETLKTLHKLLHKFALVALLFTAVGTMLGGIWADQSWGRFWGWDPKENGALWIVLWLIWLLHGRIAGQIKEFGFAIGIALINIVVALAWVGVNLLSVGLHSYGFTTAAATSLLAFCIAEISFVIIIFFAN